MITRKENWPAAFAAIIAERRNAPFAWGSNDCCLFSCDVILAITGTDLAADFRSQYDTVLSAARVLKAHGGVERIAETQTAAHGCPEWQRVTQARRGDVVLFDTDHGPALGICDGRVALFTGPSGLHPVPLTETRRAWRIA